MLIRWSDFDQTFAQMDEFRRRMDQIFDEYDRGSTASPTGSWPRMNIYEDRDHLMVRAEVPGIKEDDLNINISKNTLSLTGERAADVPEGYAVHRQERPFVRFSRSIALPLDVDLEKTKATLRDGILTLTMAKKEEVKPRQIFVKAE